MPALPFGLRCPIAQAPTGAIADIPPAAALIERLWAECQQALSPSG